MGNVDGVHADAITKRQYIYAFGLVTSLFFLWGFSCQSLILRTLYQSQR